VNPRTHALRVGVARGWHEFMLSLKSPQDQGFYVFIAVLSVGYLYLRRNTELEGLTVPFAAVALPSILGAIIAFGLVIGPTYMLAMEREDGTLLRAKAVPRGMIGHTAGHITQHSVGLLPTLAVILVPSMLLFGGLMHRGAAGWVTVAWVIALGLLATLPIGIVIGSLVPGVQKVGTWGMMPIMILAGISGIFYPVQSLWTWLQVGAQVFPMYWLGLGMRSAFLPESAAALEVAGSWRTGWTVAVLSAWAIAGMVVAPMVLRRMARRQSGSQVEAARDAALQWIR
jgi:ABC-2 type transport system permease protein